MEQKGSGDSVNHSPGRALNDSEETVITPRFDRKAVQRARPAMPLAKVSERRNKSVPTPLIIVVAILAGGIVGVIATAFHQRDRPDESVSMPVQQTTEMETKAERAVEAPASSPAGDVATDVQGNRRPAEATRESEPAATPVESGGGREGAHAELRGALDEWIAATNRRDLRKQMEFYNPTVNAFYLTRNVSREAVRAEKARVFGRADSIDVRADAPRITLGRDGRTATMRFRKQYSIEGAADARRGAVVQELRWRRTDNGWKIVSERDVRVIEDE